jgi:hypothetical protein
VCANRHVTVMVTCRWVALLTATSGYSHSPKQQSMLLAICTLNTSCLQQHRSYYIIIYLLCVILYIVGRDSSVGTATRCELDGPGIESRWGRDFQHPSRPALRPTQPPAQWVPGSFPGVKRPGRGVVHPPTSSAEVKERVELYLYSPSGPSWPVLGRPLPLLYIYIYYFFMHSSRTFRSVGYV